MRRIVTIFALAAAAWAVVALTPTNAQADHRRYSYYGQRYYQPYYGHHHGSSYYYHRPYSYHRHYYRPYRYNYGGWGRYYDDHGHHEHYGVRTPWGSFYWTD